VAEGLVYDINVKIPKEVTSVTSLKFKPQIYHLENKLVIRNLEENSLISLIDFSGKTIKECRTTSSDFECKLANDFVIVRITKKNGEVYSQKI
jgi:hypothetical protein